MPDGNIIRSAGNLKISSRKYLRSRFNVCLSLFSLEGVKNRGNEVDWKHGALVK